MASEPRSMTDVDGVPIEFSINKDGTVRISIDAFYQFRRGESVVADLDQGKAGEFARLFAATAREAGYPDGQ